MLKQHLILVFLCFSLGMQAQFSESSVTDCYFLKNATVVQKPGTTLSNTNIVIRKGIISDIGPTIAPPFDAKIIHTDSMFIYAAFIDAFSTTGIKKEEKKEDASGRGNRQRVKGAPTYEQSGITPQVSVLSNFSPSESSVSDLRKIGFGISHVIPKGKTLSGQGSVFLLKDGASADKVLLKKDISYEGQLIGAQSPSTIIGAIAKLEDVFTNAENAYKNFQSYQLNPSGLTRPDQAQELSALVPLIKKEKPIYYIAEKNKDIHRVLSLNKKFNYKIVLANVKNANGMLKELKANNSQVLLSLDLPEEVKDESKKDSTQVKKEEKNSKEKNEVKVDSAKYEVKRIELKKEDTAEMKALKARKLQSYIEIISQAAALEKNNILFAFSTLDAKTKDIKSSIKKMIDFGLSENAALAALTTHPATMLGIQDVTGTVEKGKMANLVITDKSYFNEKSSIKYMLVEGQLFDYTEPQKKEKQKDKSDSKHFLNGIWSYTVDIPDDPETGTLEFEGAPSATKMTLTSGGDTDLATDITIKDKNVLVKMTIDMDDESMPLTLDLTFDGKTFKGTATIEGMSPFPITGEKKDDPKF